MFGRSLLKILGPNTFSIPRRTYAKKVPKDLSLVVNRDYADDNLEFIGWAFMREEPVVKAFGIEDPCDLLRYFKKLLSEATVLKLVDKDCNIKSIAVCLVVNPKSSLETRTFAECSTCDQKTRRLLNLWADIADSNNLFECFKVREIWDIAFLATSPDVKGRGLSKVVTYEAKLHGQQEGFAITRIDCTNFFSAKLASSLKFVTMPPRHVSTYRDKRGCPWLPDPHLLPHPHGHIVTAYDFLT